MPSDLLQFTHFFVFLSRLFMPPKIMQQVGFPDKCSLITRVKYSNLFTSLISLFRASGQFS
jgi:hypothetical protein